MKADKLSSGRVFDMNERLEAPLFQRPYVWKDDRNWEPLWESIRDLAEKRRSGVPGRPHFLGAIVLDQLKTSTGKVPVRQIIDGQQRLTTLQLAIAAARDLASELGLTKHAQAFMRLSTNDAPLSDDTDYTFKVWPTNADRDQFRTVMTSGSRERVAEFNESNKHQLRLISEAYLFFAEAFADWVGTAELETTRSMDALYMALRDDLHIVVIDLEKEDDAQEIFQTLNTLGTPLLTSDLVKNYLFRLATQQGEDTERLYQQYWAMFDADQDYWREETRQGRLRRPRVDLFVQHYLTLRLTQEINISHLFSKFRDYVGLTNGNTAARHMALFRSYADVYRGFDRFPPNSQEAVFIRRLDQLDTTTAYPLLLEAFKRFPGADSSEELGQIMHDLESYFVRRTVCELTTKGYNRVFVELIKGLDATSFSAPNVRTLLLEQTAEASRWPDDEEFRRAWLTLSFYRRVKRSKVRMILEALESALHTNKTEIVSVEDGLTIEHLMPREWERHWPLGTASDDERDELVNTIGNLTLLTKSLNPSVSNGPWTKKRTEILKHSALNLNRGLPESWDEGTIRDRTETLFKAATKLWPRPQVVSVVPA
jgi:hypothetical protein